ncbi:MAG: glycosyltransferase family 2 protein [Candidatus Omnitrophica bacterium]|nr:glycosyltransferase family 2 protein [Candidatus Omnitrophota bacterium]
MRGCILIPVYNEAKTLPRLLSSLKGHGLDILIVDDGSADGSSDAAILNGAILIKRHKRNLGKGISLRDGFSYVVKSDYDFVITLDGDGQHDPKEVGKFVEHAGRSQAGIIQGNRMINTAKMPFVRRMTNVFMSFMISKMIGHKVEDTQCGYRLIRKDVLRAVDLKTEKFEIDSEILIDARKKGFSIDSVPIDTIYEGEASQIRPFRDTLRFILFLFKFPVKKTGDTDGLCHLKGADG